MIYLDYAATTVSGRRSELLEAVNSEQPNEIVVMDSDPALMDVLHHSTTINIRDESYRLKDRRRAGLLSRPEEQQPGTEAAITAAVAVSNRGKRTRSL